MTEGLIILLGLLSSWEEINELYRDGSWRRDMFFSFLFWDTNPNTKWKNFDSKHVSFGAFILCTMTVLIQGDLHKYTLLLSQYLGGFAEYALILILWWFFFYVRNIGMHILLRRKNFRQWKYALPIHF